jgi:pyridoxal phosphate enzyme (YggS family)
MTFIAGNIRDIKKNIPPGVTLIAVSKTKPVGDIMVAYNAGQRVFGENRIQELLSKKAYLPEDIEWHLIGHLQSNKVKLIVPFITMIQSVDTYKLLNTINSEAFKVNRVVDCLLQLHIASEETKYGFNTDEVIKLLNSPEINNMKNVRIRGLMGMATFTENMSLVRDEFRFLVKFFREIKEKYFTTDNIFKEISMGMSGDYKIAIEEGSTIIRLGSSIFGERHKYNLP